MYLLPLPPGRHDLEIGWQLHPDVWGHGYAIETTHAAVRPGNVRAAATVRRNCREWVAETGKYERRRVAQFPDFG